MSEQESLHRPRPTQETSTSDIVEAELLPVVGAASPGDQLQTELAKLDAIRL